MVSRARGNRRGLAVFRCGSRAAASGPRVDRVHSGREIGLLRFLVRLLVRGPGRHGTGGPPEQGYRCAVGIWLPPAISVDMTKTWPR